MDSFKAILVTEKNDQVSYDLQNVSVNDLSEGEILIKVAYSSINYKDMLAVQKNGGVIRNYPMIPGIDLSGTIVHTTDNRFVEGQQVIVTGFAMGMSHTGGFSEYARVPADWIVPLPNNLTLKEAMIFGTAGFTAALSIMALQENGMSTKNQPNILVTGSTGGVGSIAIQLLSKIGYNNIFALVRKDHQVDIAKSLGAADVIFANELGELKKPLNKQKFDFVLDTVGGDVASVIIPQISYGGSMSMCGNAGGIKLTTTVLPFILRGINLLGIDSVNVPINKRKVIWNEIANEWNISQTTLVNEITLNTLPEKIEAIKNGQHLGRTIIKY
ncbi:MULTISPECIES: YhdH/YhfP family quinone oxidoreductase [Bacillus]|jgi:putative YhdH/YhfP family quinone oxidoreductase|uniref:YhdH/YhfP family quinone oxidoreductase n=1 Tax=Bacillus TaxID=1386 RepID=UPI00081FAE40|nr:MULTISPECIES: YhdH/YhfP family quinone oxidoreductase [Bacillus]AOC57139.1 NADPH:quinone reductase [Bacillus pumilus]MBR0588740.1 YhdH/YhfP family quinone oxidoreductase [Bacillus pumilus DW2J2]MBR0618973.1 YhdH/YhfP family quinone oxidoreductase [Bacillus pumilus]MBR0621325.1 YhdH/YhfP family quinone oxidoreductase [Bacillus pumilus]MBR0623003.1 YhdH/YhfP family quinone oxidoreductase [Bacillus pumilus]